MDCDVGKVSHFLRFLDFGGRRWVVRTAYEQLGGWSCGLPSLAGDSRGLFWLWDVHCVAWAMAPAAVALCVGCARGVCVCVCGVSAKAGSLAVWLRSRLCVLTWFSCAGGLRGSCCSFRQASDVVGSISSRWPPLAALRQGLPSGEPAELAPSLPCQGRRHGGGASRCGVSVVGLYWARRLTEDF